MNEERGKIQAVQNRLAVANHKISQISGNWARATTVLSPAKYPAESVITDYSTLYANVEAHSLKRPNFRISQIPHALDSDVTATFVNAEEFLFKEIKEVEKREASVEGLGRLPEHLPSVSSLLLFNTQENPYKSYISLDNLEGKGPIEKKESKREIAAAPKTVTEGDEMPEAVMIEYSYKPVLGAVPELNLPNKLDLPNVAEITLMQRNLRFLRRFRFYFIVPVLLSLLQSICLNSKQLHHLQARVQLLCRRQDKW